MESITLTAPDISCDHCRTTIERELGALGGVETCAVDVPSKQVRVTFDPSTVSAAQIREALVEEGYPVAE